MATQFSTWVQDHPGVVIDGDPAGKWLVYKPCSGRARRFASYFTAHAAVRVQCDCDGSHFVIELASAQPVTVRREFQIGYERE